jgi:hypothetical protein
MVPVSLELRAFRGCDRPGHLSASSARHSHQRLRRIPRLCDLHHRTQTLHTQTPQGPVTARRPPIAGPHRSRGRASSLPRHPLGNRLQPRRLQHGRRVDRRRQLLAPLQRVPGQHVSENRRPGRDHLGRLPSRTSGFPPGNPAVPGPPHSPRRSDRNRTLPDSVAMVPTILRHLCSPAIPAITPDTITAAAERAIAHTERRLICRTLG